MECIPYPYWIYTKCFTTLISYEWEYGSTLTLLCLCRFGMDFRGYWGRPEPEWCFNAMVEAQTPHGVHLTSILDLYKVFYHLYMLWMGIRVHPLTLLCPCNCGWSFGEIGVDLSPSDVGMICLMLQTPMDCILHLYWMYKKCFGTLVCYGWAYGCYGWAYGFTLLLVCLLCWFGVDFQGYWGSPEPEGCCNVMVKALTPCVVHSTAILDIYKVFHHLDMLWMGIWVHPHTGMPVMPVQVRGAEPDRFCNVIVEAQTPHGVYSTSIWSL